MSVWMDVGFQKHKSLKYLPFNRGIMADHYKIWPLSNQKSYPLINIPYPDDPLI